MVFSDFETAEHSTLSTKSTSDKFESQVVKSECQKLIFHNK
ncbi:hypothetical protein VC87395_003364 [Vibrio paracholerae 87395]|nr:hypothetical protein VCHE09_3226 [Vibrio paracholerae HE-09]EMP90555.1 hypothetical protein VC87395_003364 [Vibrio paracholerae 87395]